MKKRMRRQRRRRRQMVMQEISLTPLIDTALTLLIIFMLTTPMMHNAIKINLPQGKAQEAANIKQELIVYLDKDGKLFFNGQAVSSKPKLIEEIKKVVGVQKDKTVFVQADINVNYGNVIEIVDQIKVVGGVQYVALATKKVV